MLPETKQRAAGWWLVGGACYPSARGRCFHLWPPKPNDASRHHHFIYRTAHCSTCVRPAAQRTPHLAASPLPPLQHTCPALQQLVWSCAGVPQTSRSMFRCCAVHCRHGMAWHEMTHLLPPPRLHHRRRRRCPSPAWPGPGTCSSASTLQWSDKAVCPVKAPWPENPAALPRKLAPQAPRCQRATNAP